MASFWQRIASHFFPVKLRSHDGPYGRVDLMLLNGEMVVNGPRASLSYGPLMKIWRSCAQELDLGRRSWMRILVLGCGAGSAVRLLRDELGSKAPITAVDGDDQMIDWARSEFGLSSIADVEWVRADAFTHLGQDDAFYDLVLVDLFHDLDLSPGICSSGFSKALRDRMSKGGMVCFNSIAYDPRSQERCERLRASLEQHFDHVTEKRYMDDNRMFIALCDP